MSIAFQDAVKLQERLIVQKVMGIKPRMVGALGAGFNLGLSAELDAACRVILDDSVSKVIDQTTIAISSTVDKTSEEFQKLVQQIFDNLSTFEKQVEALIDRFFQNLSVAVQDLKKNLVEPIIQQTLNLEKQIFEDINQVLDKVFNYFDGKAEEFKLDMIKHFGFLLIPNPLDSCRAKYNLGLTPGFELTHTDVFNLFECKLLKRLDNEKLTVREIKEIYATLQLQSFKMTCLGRGAPAFQKIYMGKWLNYGQLFEIWQEFDDSMTPQEAYNQAIRSLNQAREEYQAKIAEVNLVQQTVNNAVDKAVKAYDVATQAINQADSAQDVATQALSNATCAQELANNALEKAENALTDGTRIALRSTHGGHLSDRNDDRGNAQFVSTLAAWEIFTVISCSQN